MNDTERCKLEVDTFLEHLEEGEYYRDQIASILDRDVDRDTWDRRESAARVISEVYRLPIKTAWEIVGHVVIAQQIKMPERL